MAEKKETVQNKPEEKETVEKKPEKKVLIRLPLDRQNKEDAVVWVNERRFLIKRGVPVEVPESVAEVLKNKEEMEIIRFQYEDDHAKVLE